MDGMGKFNSDDHYIYYCCKNPLEEMEYVFTVNKRASEYHQLKSIFLCFLF